MSSHGDDLQTKGTGTWTRLALLVQALVTIGLALVAVFLLTWLSERPGLRFRLDLTQSGVNTLDDVSVAVLEKLPGKVEIDVFFRPLEYPYTQVGGMAQERMFALLLLAEDSAPGRIDVTNHDLSNLAEHGADVEARMRELNIKEVNVVVVTYGERHHVLHLTEEIAEIDAGNPNPQQFVPARLVAFRGEEALVTGLLKVTQGERAKVLFSTGHGERDLYGDDSHALGKLETLLVEDGFNTARWEGEESGPIPDDCALLVIFAPEEPFTDSELESVRSFVAAGGRLIAAPGPIGGSGPGSLAALLAEYGIQTEEGIVARPFVGPSGQASFGVPRCAEVIVRPQGMPARNHPITESLRRGERRVRMPFTRAFTRGAPPQGGSLRDILLSSEFSWLDLPDANGKYDWIPQRDREGPFTLALTAVFPPLAEVPPERRPRGPSGETARPESRILAVGSVEAFSNALLDANRGFCLNAFNWAASREFRVSVRPRTAEARRIEVGEGKSLFYMNVVITFLLPLACLLIGGAIALRRRS